MNAMMSKLVNSDSGFDTVPLRVGAGIIFAAHGAQKLFGWFGGYGLQGTADWMASIGLEPGMLIAAVTGGAELFGGLLLIIGLLIRPAALILAITMLAAILSVHVQHGLFLANNGYEFGLALLVISVGLVIRGAGSLSVDSVLQAKISA